MHIRFSRPPTYSDDGSEHIYCVPDSDTFELLPSRTQSSADQALSFFRSRGLAVERSDDFQRQV